MSGDHTECPHLRIVAKCDSGDQYVQLFNATGLATWGEQPGLPTAHNKAVLFCWLSVVYATGLP